MSADVHNVQKEVKKFIGVFVALLVLTVITVAITGLKVGVGVGVTLALIVALSKGTLVAGFFMHLFEEVKSIYLILGLTLFFLVSMIALIVASYQSTPEGTMYVVEDSAPDIHHH